MSVKSPVLHLKSLTQDASGDAETVRGNAPGRQKQISNIVKFKIALARSPGWSLKINKGSFSASALSVEEDGSMTAVSTKCEFLHLFGLPLAIINISFSDWGF
jgi:hypothetical protein